MKNALVVSGGGSKGAFAVGAIERLREAGITWDIVVGTSTGALISPLVVTDEIQELRALYTRVHTEDIVQKRALLDIFIHDAIYDATPLWDLINSIITAERYAQILASPVELYLTTVNLQTGQIEYWNPHQDGPLGAPVSGAPLPRETFMKAMLASASEPVLMPNVRIINGGHQYTDGGVREVAPLKVAIDNGAEALYAIVLSPEQQVPSDATYTFVVKTLLRIIDLFLQEVTANDVDNAILYNRAIRYLSQVQEKAATMLTPSQSEALFADPQNLNPFVGKRLLELHIIRPAEALPADSLEFDPVTMAQMMEMGREAAEQGLNSGPRLV